MNRSKLQRTYMAEINLLRHYPKSTRPIEERGQRITDEHRATARRFDGEFFDGDRLYGYGGYSYHPRFWTDTVRLFCEHYQLVPGASVLDVGCAKGFMMYDFKLAMPDIRIRGLDISQYAKEHAEEEVKDCIDIGTASKLPYPDHSFDLVISINTIHNLPLEECKEAIREIQRVSRKYAFITMDAWRTEREREQLAKWNLTALTYMSVQDWEIVFQEVGFTGDYWWFIAESE